MKEIKLDCFLKDQSCQIASQNQNFFISNPFENKYLLEINNHGGNDCQVNLELTKSQENNLISQIDLLLSKSNELIFQGNLQDFFSQKTLLGLIESRTSQQYLFNFDFSNLFLSREKIFLSFDFILNFNCLEPTTEGTYHLEGNENREQQSKPLVLAASTSDNLQIDNKELYFSPIFYLVSSCLFVFVFFVIIKLINGKKKKKASKFVV